MNFEKLENALEAILFSAGEPVHISKLSQALEISIKETVFLLENLNKRYKSTGLQLLRLDNHYQLSTKSIYAKYVKKSMEIKRSTPLSNAALEVLSIIAYNQPVSKSFIEQIRGIDSSSVVNTLVTKGLIEEAGRLDLPGRPLSYRTTTNFLRCFSISSLTELPQLPRKINQDEVVNILK